MWRWRGRHLFRGVDIGGQAHGAKCAAAKLRTDAVVPEGHASVPTKRQGVGEEIGGRSVYGRADDQGDTEE